VFPGLATVLVGDDPGSVSYVTGKNKACAAVGIRSFHHHLPTDVSEDYLLKLVGELNANPEVHGILVQTPLPKHLDERKVLNAIEPDKDVDGLHPANMGRLMIGTAIYPPCTPAGILELLRRTDTPTSGAEVVVVGRSTLVGKPVAMMLMQKSAGANATVTVCHTGTQNIGRHTRQADILIVAAGHPLAVTRDMIKLGATVIDVGVNRIGTTASGKAKLVGDVDFAGACEVAGKITPVPGGVGPMTIAMLLRNTVRAAKLRM
jgi:methylenetetrahydrofolate dehydrogenase (NADP+)/methenyltetrahydrofolate cyclohydrolase